MSAPKKDDAKALLKGVKKRNVRAIARMISLAEAAKPESRDVLAEIYRLAGRAHVIGLTGVPGSGKSTLVKALADAIRVSGRTVGIVAIDPSSPFSGGAILGDRIRMTDLTGDDGVFIRSMATRGAMGGLARASLEAVDVLDAAGFDIILIETVGVGQDEVDIVQAAHTVVVVSAPGLGDEVQAIKAGILEIADIHVVSKCDRSDANATIADIRGMLTLGIRMPKDHGLVHGKEEFEDKPPAADGEWRVEVVATSAETGDGIGELLDTLDAHAKHLNDTGGMEQRRRDIIEMRVIKTAEDIIRRDFKANHDKLAGLMNELMARTIDPHQAAATLLATFKYKEGKYKDGCED
ncbi:MAG: methylmalonyl Co-A mutase-associated GTPase MeaB [Proteobacteria bacterium]|nr:methylmalonyl Co-A mutase-associated GTPase MeaB [Pseudomonadota bacterium]MDA1022721.1 methylmalonyl Co-A mutase-associated GTPase MeaB [Pseudomonadota bacterium]